MMNTVDPYIDELPVLVEAILKESMRKYPTVGMFSLREVTQDTGFYIPHPKQEGKSILLKKGTWYL